ncbi:MAG: tyrosine-type recombinase/integrase [Acetatifactor sp.]|nr:tyrosine-type recombinase/integrase [Acetatifactor sp.]
MLIKCPECELQVSDKALCCPHCGYPMQSGEKARRANRSAHKYRRLPNGFGQISEIRNRNLRKPFRVMVTVGKNSAGRPICKPLKPEAYFSTYGEAYAALMEYNRSPYDLEEAITVKELYEKWSEEYFKTLKSGTSIQAVMLAWSYCASLYDMRVTDVRARHVKACMEEGVAVVKGRQQHPNASTKNRIKTLFNLMLDYALEYELVDRNYARTFHLSDEVIKEIATVKKKHLAFTDEEMRLLWEHVDDKRYVDVLLIQCYSGWRPQEIGLLELKNTDLKEWTFKGGIKTEAGTDRVVPIHPRIRGLVERKYREAEALGSKYLFNCTNPMRKHDHTILTYDRYHKGFEKIRDELKLNPLHRPHDGRTHFVTSAKRYGVDEYAIKYMVGHAISDITEKIYTKRELSWLRKELEKIE